MYVSFCLYSQKFTSLSLLAEHLRPDLPPYVELDGEMMFQYIKLSCIASRADALMKKYILIQTNKADL